ncbi:mucin-2-like [Actinia tenebrosa]|uniref:Mucin-2-like n=1 Tax=Actinia tenebrosa TaxID=6105 RepID=A0A6P8IQT3_ACTTE|nr:mucin-2-like [Actinia tenebrosa]
MKAIFLFMILAGFSFQYLISAPINDDVESLDEREGLKSPDGELLKRSKHQSISSLIDALQKPGSLDGTVLKKNEDELPDKRNRWRRCKRWWCRKNTRRRSRKTSRVKASAVKTKRPPTSSTTNPATRKKKPTTPTAIPTPAVAQTVPSVDFAKPGKTSSTSHRINPATRRKEPDNLTQPTAVAVPGDAVESAASAVQTGKTSTSQATNFVTSANKPTTKTLPTTTPSVEESGMAGESLPYGTLCPDIEGPPTPSMPPMLLKRDGNTASPPSPAITKPMCGGFHSYG